MTIRDEADAEGTGAVDAGRDLAGAEMAVGRLVELEIGDVAHGGIFVARHGGRVVFVADTLPGERVLARVTEVKKRFARADTVRVLSAAPERRDHVWPEAGIDRAPDQRPGGAEFGHIRLPHQRELKRRVVTDALSRFGGVDWAGEVEALPGDDALGGTRWRTRVTLHIDDSGRAGPFASRSHRVVPVAGLPLALADIEELAPLNEVFSGPGRIDFAAPAESDARMRVRLDDPAQPARPPAVLTELVHGNPFLVDEDGFWQVHRHAATTLYDAVAEAIDLDLLDPEAANLDLYGGVGLLAAALAEAGGPDTYVETVESSRSATEHARQNLADWQGATAVTARVDQYLMGLEREATAGDRDALKRATVVLDPPRAGAGRQVVEALAGFGPAQIVYVACDPVAFARDVGLFAPLGYRVESLRSFDLFPNTHHVECVARLRRV